jgi:ribosomal protein S18 acetylase RimI-like enzyme
MRLARPDEAPLLAALVERAYAPYVPIIGRRPAPMDDDYSGRVAAGQAWVLEEGASIIGLLVLEDHADHLWLDNIAVEPDRHHQGIGQRLMHFTMTEAARRGFDEVRLLTNEKMTRNVGVYERLGFREYQRLESSGFKRVYMRAAVTSSAAPGTPPG